MNGKRANYWKQRRGIFAPKHMRVLQGETFRVFSFLCAIANQKKEPIQVAETGIKQIARTLFISVNTSRRALLVLEEADYIKKVEGGYFVSKLLEGGSEFDPPEDLWGSESDPPMDQILHPPGSESDPPPGQKVIPRGSESDPLFPVNDSNNREILGGIREVSRTKENKKNTDPNWVARRYLAVLSAVTGRKFRTLTSVVKKKVKANLKEWTAEEIIAVPIAVWATHPQVQQAKHASDVYLRDGENPRTRNGQTYGGYAWISRAYDMADGIELEEKLVDIAKLEGVDDLLKRKGFVWDESMNG